MAIVLTRDWRLGGLGGEKNESMETPRGKLLLRPRARDGGTDGRDETDSKYVFRCGTNKTLNECMLVKEKRVIMWLPISGINN